jgi:two-component system, OmpR family, response regulator
VDVEAVTAPARLLVVDDEATILELLSGSLRLAGFDVVTATTGAGAVRAAASSRPDLVLLDVMMPDGDGFEALRRIRSGGCEVPVIFLGLSPCRAISRRPSRFPPPKLQGALA